MPQNNSAGRLIVIEGLDGSGKATQSKLLTQYFSERGEDVLQISFPDYESESSALVRMYLSGKAGPVSEVNAYAASSFYAADRYISYQTHWKNKWEAGYTIIADRYTTSNAVHQMSKLPRSEWDAYLLWLWDFEFTRMKLPQPSLVLYLDMPPEFSRQLMLKRYYGDESRADMHERDLAYQISCREAALFAADKLCWKIIPCCEGGELVTIDAMAGKIRGCAEDHFHNL